MSSPPPPLAKLLVFSILAVSACVSDSGPASECGSKCDALGEFPEINKAPKSVLFVPMSSAYMGLSEQKWQSDDVEFDRAIAELTTEYTALGAEEIVTLPRLERWEDFESEVNKFEGRTFDRVIIVGHGALDGPITRGSAVRTIDAGHIVEKWTMQPGLVRELEVTYSDEILGAFIAENLDALVAQYDSVAETLYDQLPESVFEEYAVCMGDQLESMRGTCRAACLQTICTTFEGEERNSNCESGCTLQCLDDFSFAVAVPTCSPLVSKSREYLDEESFDSFASTLAGLTANDGLIFLGHCNAATDADSATLAPSLGGHRSYTDLLAASTGRYVAGPIGKTSGQDIINRVAALEKQGDQNYLYIATPSK